VPEFALDKKLLDILACPLCKGPRHTSTASSRRQCSGDRLAFPVMLEEEARTLNSEDPLMKD
jgi:uncharacterized protein YbaR (Trm112 family)